MPENVSGGTNTDTIPGQSAEYNETLALYSRCRSCGAVFQKYIPKTCPKCGGKM